MARWLGYGLLVVVLLASLWGCGGSKEPQRSTERVPDGRIRKNK